MHHLFIEYVYLILIILGLVMLANRLRLAYPIVLVLGGLALSCTDEFSRITIDPELVFFIFLPPLLYEMNRRAEFDEELIRKYLALIDIEEFKIREKLLEESGRD